MTPRFMILIREWKVVSLGKKGNTASNFQRLSSIPKKKTTRKKGKLLECHRNLARAFVLLTHLE